MRHTRIPLDRLCLRHRGEPLHRQLHIASCMNLQKYDAWVSQLQLHVVEGNTHPQWWDHTRLRNGIG